MNTKSKHHQPHLKFTLVVSGLLLGALSAPAQSTAPSAPASNANDEEIVVLTPFEVDASNDHGYYSERTLAGSRIDTKLSDIAASISLINREQMEDTAATDINDVFLYDLNTEGANTYTPTFNGARGGLRDYASGFSHTDGGYQNDQTSNRIRGLAAPDSSRNYYPSIAAVGFDSYNTRSVEINRGPNSLLFGQGSPAGIVNQNTASAYTNIKESEIQVRFGENGTYRAYLNHNQPIIDDKLGVYIAALYDHQGFERKPSYDNKRRIYGAITYTPTRNLRFRANYEDFNSRSSRPNTLTPRDAVTPWLAAGRPAYDPVTRMVTIQDTGQVRGPYVQSSLSPGYLNTYVVGDAALRNTILSGTNPNAGYIPGIDFVDSGRQVVLIDSRDNYFATQRRPVGVATTNPNFQDPVPAAAARTAAQHLIADRNFTRSAFGPVPTGISGWFFPGVTNKSIYDWTKYNVNAMNSGTMDAQTLNLEVDFKITDNWFVQAGYFDQSMDGEDNYTVSQLEAATLWIDPNVNLPDGTPNPFFGQPFVHDTQPDTFLRTIDNENFRVQTALKFDFSGHDSILRFLGKQNLIAIGTRQNYDTTQIRTRAVYTGGHPAFLPFNDLTTTGNYSYWANSGRMQRQYYMGSPGQQATVTRSAPRFGQPSFGGPTETDIRYYNWSQGDWVTYQSEWANALSDASTMRTRRTTDSLVLAWNASMLDDRLVPTIGYRHDRISNQSTQGTAGLAGRADPTNVLNAADYTDRGYPILDLLWNNWGNELTDSGDTYTYGATFDVWRNDHHELTVFYNQSENFNPPPSAQVDFFGNELTRPTGDGKDYGFSMGINDNKLVFRVSWYETTNNGERTGTANFARDRLQRVDTDLMFPWAEVIARIEDGQLPYFTDAENLLGDPYTVFPRTAAIEARMAELTGLPVDYYTTLGAPVGATQTNRAEGMEIGVTYNPISNWTFRGGVSSQETSYSVVAPEVDAWMAERMPVWQAAMSGLSAAQNQWLFGGTREVDLTNFWSSTGFNSNTDRNSPTASSDVADWFQDVVQGQIDLYKTQEGVPVPTQRKWRANMITKYTFTDGKLRNSFIGGGVRWEDKAAIGYFGRAGDPTQPNTINAPDASRPVFDKSNTYFDIWAGYRTKVYNDTVDFLIQLNVRNIFESGGLQPIAVNYDGTPHTFRIVDPREIMITTTLKF